MYSIAPKSLSIMYGLFTRSILKEKTPLHKFMTSRATTSVSPLAMSLLLRENGLFLVLQQQFLVPKSLKLLLRDLETEMGVQYCCFFVALRSWICSVLVSILYLRQRLPKIFQGRTRTINRQHLHKDTLVLSTLRGLFPLYPDLTLYMHHPDPEIPWFWLKYLLWQSFFVIFSRFPMSYFSHVEIQDVLPKSKSVAIPSISYEAVTRKPNHRWDLENYVALIILANECSNDWAEKTSIFNAYFRDQLTSSVGLSEAALRSMYYKIQNMFGYPIGRWEVLKTTLEGAALKIGLHLELKPHTESLKNTATPETDGDSRNLPHTLARSQTYRSKPQGKGKNQSSRKIPKLAFRAFDERSQGINSSTHIRAGCFKNCEVTSPPHPSSRLYRHDARRHIGRIHQGSTPMISVSCKTLW